jgi:hypothetical protein
VLFRFERVAFFFAIVVGVEVVVVWLGLDWFLDLSPLPFLSLALYVRWV